MELTEGHLLGWAATARALEEIAPDEVELLPDIAATIHAPTARIGGVPGAFDLSAAQLQSVAGAVFPIVLACMNSVAPKLFDAALDIGKTAIKTVIEQRLKAKPAAAAAASPVDTVRVHQLIRVAVLERRLSPATADVIANAVIAQLALSPAPVK